MGNARIGGWLRQDILPEVWPVPTHADKPAERRRVTNATQVEPAWKLMRGSYGRQSVAYKERVLADFGARGNC